MGVKPIAPQRSILDLRPKPAVRHVKQAPLCGPPEPTFATSEKAGLPDGADWLGNPKRKGPNFRPVHQARALFRLRVTQTVEPCR